MANATSASDPKSDTKPKSVILDLSSPIDFIETTVWVRNHVILQPTNSDSKAEPLELTVSLPQGGTASLFMNRVDHYILGFRGDGKVHLLRDEHLPEFQRKLVSQGYAAAGQIAEPLAFESSHAGLETFGKAHGDHPRSFSRYDLVQASLLAQYRDGSMQERLKTPLSLLVCMLSESARLLQVRDEFLKLYYHAEAVPDPAIKDWSNACKLLDAAEKQFPKDRSRDAVERFEKRGREIHDLLAAISSKSGLRANDPDWIQRVIDGTSSLSAGACESEVKRLRQIAQQLDVSKSKPLLDMARAAKTQGIALKAAAYGLTRRPTR